MKTQKRIALSLTSVAVGALAIAGCGTADNPSATASSAATASTGADASTSGTTSAASFNSADVDFATMMYPHHAQAVDMAKMVAGKDAGPDVTALAAEIEKAQAPEMDAFARLLAQWGKPAPSAGGHGGHSMTGMMSADQMSKLAALRGAEFDREWLTMMIEHHRGAIEMADTELAKGVNAESRQIAESIKSSQQAEINRMQALLK